MDALGSEPGTYPSPSDQKPVFVKEEPGQELGTLVEGDLALCEYSLASSSTLQQGVEYAQPDHSPLHTQHLVLVKEEPSLDLETTILEDAEVGSGCSFSAALSNPPRGIESLPYEQTAFPPLQLQSVYVKDEPFETDLIDEDVESQDWHSVFPASQQPGLESQFDSENPAQCHVPPPSAYQEPPVLVQEDRAAEQGKCYLEVPLSLSEVKAEPDEAPDEEAECARNRSISGGPDLEPEAHPVPTVPYWGLKPDPELHSTSEDTADTQTDSSELPTFTMPVSTDYCENYKQMRLVDHEKPTKCS